MIRAQLAGAVVTALAAACADSTARLRGSLAAGTADAYSDIDVEWIVPDGRVPACVADIRPVLDRVRAVAAVRTSPDFFHSRQRRLVFVRFAGVPLFWRLDLAVREVSATADPGSGDPAAHAREGEWSRPASALANALGAIKAVARGRTADANGLLERGFARIDEPNPATGQWVDDVTRLSRAAAAREPELAPLAEETIALARAELGA
ncbi:hypothetical protein VSH64_00970 [Amycolatopsis rhabdoformis]|uniref:Nucleotidyltransferase domain-containing protein n=1 Tax=Amycolatopsis rhabdoformis TaxID=1448059 RepID=A0ABZ1IB95_9PSEU|nr:hypothetical protein [Amycolatopsis rhabdoformis]WSE30715.1 hypothetical protein VSH64_00970 [Amycolatopsis rhabdoformis]